MDKREELASAFYDSAGIKWENVPPNLRALMMGPRLDAILVCLREPSDAMHAAGERAIRDKKGNETGVVPIETELAFDAYQAMIDELIKEGNPNG